MLQDVWHKTQDAIQGTLDNGAMLASLEACIEHSQMRTHTHTERHEHDGEHLHDTGGARKHLLITMFLCSWTEVRTHQFSICVSNLNSVQQMVSGELAGECLQTGFERNGLPPQRALLDMVYLSEKQLSSVQRMVSAEYCEGLFPDTVCWKWLRNT